MAIGFQLWLSLADKYLKSKNVDWSKEEEKCFCDKWREDDEELGIQIVKVNIFFLFIVLNFYVINF